MSLGLDQRYFIELMPKLEKVKRIDNNLYQFRCPICNDSKKDKSKARGYVYNNSSEDFLRFKCHNCSFSSYFRTFLRLVDPFLYKRYVVDSMKESGIYKEKVFEEKKEDFDIFKNTKKIIVPREDEKLKSLVRLDKLNESDESDECLEYVKNRKIPKSMYPYLYYTDDFCKYVNSIIPNKIKNTIKDKRLIIPYFDENGKLFAFQGRSIDPKSTLRYFTIKIDENFPKIYGLDRLDKSKRIYCTEGPIDSMFLPNALAVSGASYNSPCLEKIKKNVIIVPDNERRNKEVCKSIESAIEMGFKVCLWRRGLPFKDINEAILNGYSVDEILNIIEEDSVSGFTGKIKFKLWCNQ